MEYWNIRLYSKFDSGKQSVEIAFMAETRPEVTSGNVQGKYHYVGVRCVKFEEQQTDDNAEERLLAADLVVFISTKPCPTDIY